MALTLVTPPVLASSSLFNQFYNLLTGNMQDQMVTIQNTLVLKGIGPAPAAPTLSLASGGVLTIATYKYQLTYQSAGGESLPCAIQTITTTSGNQKINVPLTAGPTGTTGIVVYRTVAGGSVFDRVNVFANATTTFVDNTPDASLVTTVHPPGNNTYGGAIKLVDSTGATTLTISNDGVIFTPGGGGGTSLGSTVITGTLSVTSTSTLSSGTLFSYTMSGANALVWKANPSDVSEHAIGCVHETGAGLGFYDYSTSSWLCHWGRTGTFSTASTLTVSAGGLVVSAGGAAITGSLAVSSGGISCSAGASITGNANVFSGNVQLDNNYIISQKDSGGTARTVMTLTNSNILVIRSGASGFYVQDSSGVTRWIIGSSKLGKSSDGDIIDASGTTTYIKGSAAINFQVPGGTDSCYADSNGLHVASGLALYLSDGSDLKRVHLFTGTGNGTFNHLSGTTPSQIQLTTSAGTSTQTMGYDTVGGSTVHVDTGAGLAWVGLALVV